MTFLPTRDGWLYLAVLLDLYSRKVIGWAMSEQNDETLTLAALQMALDQRLRSLDTHQRPREDDDAGDEVVKPGRLDDAAR